ncbi:polysaccharide export outer membrane protein [Rhodoligotrophos appendicifer]|uniref:polysaccharide biosynthesis/export family protein n=1 Tax=Rhodoligotrophos appendicifer TaxID=987056 RepID=UPI001FE48CAA|nr:polysaccharide biosynthesis/export family protein [Rhodoligotrophos appendicifer]
MIIGCGAFSRIMPVFVVILCVNSLGCSARGPERVVLAGANADGTVHPAAIGKGQAGAGLRMVSELPPPDHTNGAEQPISANDVLAIDVFQVDSLDRTVQVDATGNVSLPLIGSVAAAGKSVRQLEQEIEKAYEEDYLQSPDVTVFMKESVGQRVTMDGEVTKAGIYPVSSNSSLLDAVAMAGGLSNIADPTKVYVYRSYGGSRLVANYDVDAIRNGERSNPNIYGGDVIVVFTSQSKVAMNNLMQALGMATSATRLAVMPL